MDPAVAPLYARGFAAEKGKIFARAWQVVGHRMQVAQAGDYFTTEHVGEPLLIVRGADGKLRGFYNVCRHRAGPAAEGCESRKLFRCGYHGWTYGLDGSLISATEVDGVEGFRLEDFALAPVRPEESFNISSSTLTATQSLWRGSGRVAAASGEISIFRNDAAFHLISVAFEPGRLTWTTISRAITCPACIRD